MSNDTRLPSISDLLVSPNNQPPPQSRSHVAPGAANPDPSDKLPLFNKHKALSDYDMPSKPPTPRVFDGNYSPQLTPDLGSLKGSSTLGRRKFVDHSAPPTPTIEALNSSRLNLSNTSIDTDISAVSSLPVPSPWCSPLSSLGGASSTLTQRKQRGHSSLARSVVVAHEDSPEPQRRQSHTNSTDTPTSDHFTPTTMTGHHTTTTTTPTHHYKPKVSLTSGLSGLNLANTDLRCSPPLSPAEAPVVGSTLDAQLSVVAAEHARLRKVEARIAYKLEQATRLLHAQHEKLRLKASIRLMQEKLEQMQSENRLIREEIARRSQS